MPRDMTQIAEPTGQNPFASTAPRPHPQRQQSSQHISRSRASSQSYKPVELEIKRESLKSAPRIQPAPPARVHRQSYQSSHRSSRPVSQLPRLSTDPEKSLGAVEAQRWQDDVASFHKPYFYENANEVNSKCLRVLLYLSGPVFIISALAAIWTILGFLLAVVLHPVNAIRKKTSFREQFVGLASPSIRLHLSCILASVRDDATSAYSAPMLLLVNLLAPLLSIVVVLSAWTAACFWFYAAIIGDPEGLDRESRRSSQREEEDADGKASALRVRRWWRSLLIKTLR